MPKLTPTAAQIGEGSILVGPRPRIKGKKVIVVDGKTVTVTVFESVRETADRIERGELTNADAYKLPPGFTPIAPSAGRPAKPGNRTAIKGKLPPMLLPEASTTIHHVSPPRLLPVSPPQMRAKKRKSPAVPTHLLRVGAQAALLRCFHAGLTMRQTERQTGTARHTIMTYFREFEKIHGKRMCKCGRPIGHKGWCKPLFEKSLPRQIAMAKMKRGGRRKAKPKMKYPILIDKSIARAMAVCEGCQKELPARPWPEGWTQYGRSRIRISPDRGMFSAWWCPTCQSSDRADRPNPTQKEIADLRRNLSRDTDTQAANQSR